MSSFRFFQILPLLLFVHPVFTQNSPSLQMWPESNNWQYTLQQTLGSDISPAWMMDMISDGAEVLEAPYQSGFILIMDGEFESLEEGKAELESAMIDGHMQLLPASDVRPLGKDGYSIRISGKIQSRSVFGQRIHFIDILGDSKSILVLQTEVSSEQKTFSMARELAIQLMHGENEGIWAEN